MSGYFKFFPNINYPYKGKIIGTKTDQITNIECSDIMIRYRIKEEILRSPLSYYVYTWKDTDRPDSVAYDYYGSTDYAWLVIFSANVFDYINDLPMNQVTFLDYLEKTYSVSEPYSLQGVHHHYEDDEGFWIDEETFNLLPVEKRRDVSVFEFEYENNEDRRKIKLLSRKFLSQISKEFESSMKSIKTLRKEFNGEFISGQ